MGTSWMIIHLVRVTNMNCIMLDSHAVQKMQRIKYKWYTRSYHPMTLRSLLYGVILRAVPGITSCRKDLVFLLKRTDTCKISTSSGTTDFARSSSFQKKNQMDQSRLRLELVMTWLMLWLAERLWRYVSSFSEDWLLPLHCTYFQVNHPSRCPSWSNRDNKY